MLNGQLFKRQELKTFQIYLYIIYRRLERILQLKQKHLNRVCNKG